jgi:hypothetical protein
MMVDDCSAYEKQTNIEIDIFFKNLSMASVIGENKNPRDLKVYTKSAPVRNADDNLYLHICTSMQNMRQ